jgi:hypothetical protein
VTESTSAESLEPDALFDDEVDVEIEPQIDEYDLTSSPNDFNVATIFDFIQRGSVQIPGFQRNYVWDAKRASRLIESIIIGLPIPQIFLYEQARNQFLVIDGQQRLMTIYYFMHGRFPKATRRADLRAIFDEHGKIPDEVIEDPEYFDKFRLRLPDVAEGSPNKFSGLTYETLGDYQSTFDLRTIRNIIVKQVKPSGDHSSIFEMFNRLNTGGVLLTPQEIRSSMYHSDFLTTLTKLNSDPRWREILGQPQPDNHAKDVEVLLRATAMWKRGPEYTPSMTSFLNRFAQHAATWKADDLKVLNETWDWFLSRVPSADASALRAVSGRLSVAIFDATFAALARRRAVLGDFDLPRDYLPALAADKTFRDNVDDRPTDRAHVRARVLRAEEVLLDHMDPGT